MKTANKLKLIQINIEEQLNELHKKNGESLNSRMIFNEFIINLNIDFNQLIDDLQKDNF